VLVQQAAGRAAGGRGENPATEKQKWQAEGAMPFVINPGRTREK